MSHIQVGECFAIPLEDGRFAAAQVHAIIEPGRYDVVVFDWIGEKRPKLADLAGAKPQVMDHHSMIEHPHRWQISGEPPDAIRSVGIAPPMVAFSDPVRTYDEWQGIADQFRRQHWWDTVVPAKEKRRYKRAKANAGATFQTIGPRLDKKALDKNPHLIVLTYAGRDRAIIDYVATRHLIRDLIWQAHEQKQIDASAAHLEALTIDVDGPLKLKVGMLRKLTLRGDVSAVKVSHPKRGAGLRLCVEGMRAAPPRIVGLSKLSKLTLRELRSFDARALLGYPALRKIEIECGNTLAHPEALKELRKLEEMTLSGIYLTKIAKLPRPKDTPNLRMAEFIGVRQTDVAALKARYKAITVHVRGAQKQAWIDAYALNPFDEDDEAAAFNAYRTASRRLSKLQPDDEAAMYNTMIAFAKKKLAVDRDRVWAAFCALGRQSPVKTTNKELKQWFGSVA